MPVDMSRSIKVLRVCERNLRAVELNIPRLGVLHLRCHLLAACSRGEVAARVIALPETQPKQLESWSNRWVQASHQQRAPGNVDFALLVSLAPSSSG